MSDRGQSFAYNFSDITKLLTSIDGVSCVDLHAKMFPAKSIESPDKYFVFRGPQKCVSAMLMVCYQKNHMKFEAGFIYAETRQALERFLRCIGQSALISELDSCKVDFSGGHSV